MESLISIGGVAWGGISQLVFRTGYGVLLVLFLLRLIPIRHLYLSSEKFGGYVSESVRPGFLLTRLGANVVLTLWCLAAIRMCFGSYDSVTYLFASGLNLVLSYYFFISMRWTSLSRGFGAPGFMFFWAGAAAFLTAVHPLFLVLFRLDFGFIMFSAGFYKLMAGYAKGDGMELGMVNPMWGYFPSFSRKISPKSPVFWVLNQMGWSFEILGAILMFSSVTREIGALIIMASFIFVGTQIRLGLLAPLVVLCGFIFSYPNGFIEQALKVMVQKIGLLGGVSEIGLQSILGLVGTAVEVETNLVSNTSSWSLAVATVISIYLILRPVVLVGLYYNYFSKKSLPRLFQVALEKYSNFFGIILWRVFTVEVVNFFVEINRINRENAEVSAEEKVKISHYWDPLNFRFNQVIESITIATIFTALKYYPNSPEIFQNRLKRYVRTFGLNKGEILEFKVFKIEKMGDSFNYSLSSRYEVDCDLNVSQAVCPILNKNIKDLNGDQCIITSQQVPSEGYSEAAVHACKKPGSYLPA